MRVTGVEPDQAGGDGSVVVDVALRRRALVCPSCSFRTRRRYDRRQVDSSWRHLDLGGRVCRLRMRRRRLSCPEHGMPLARSRTYRPALWSPRRCRSPGPGTGSPRTSRIWFRHLPFTITADIPRISSAVPWKPASTPRLGHGRRACNRQRPAVQQQIVRAEVEFQLQ